MDYDKEINFFRFLASYFSVGLYDNFFLKPFFRKYSQAELGRRVSSLRSKIVSGNAPAGLSLYVHVPFCAELCRFCHCARTPLVSPRLVANYIEGVREQLAFFAALLSGISVDSLYFGGGSPSLLSADEYSKIVGLIRESVVLTDNIQINFEAHPAQLTWAKVKALKAVGVRRVSLGVQSFDATVLREVGRRQSLLQVADSVAMLRKARIETINMDLMAGLPGQTVGSFIKDVTTAVKLGADVIHLTPFADIRASACGREMGERAIFAVYQARDRMMKDAKATVERAGYQRFGFEAYAKDPRGVCQHEAHHLKGADSIIGIGPFSNGILGGELLYRAEPVDKRMRYVEYSGVRIDKRYSMAQYLILNMLESVSKNEFRSIFGEPVEEAFSDELAFLIARGIVSDYKDVLQYSGSRSAEGLFEYFALTKAFYGAKIINALKKLYRERYKSEYRYSFSKDGFLRKMEDHWFLQIYYDAGM